jgi:hypothetical protein
MARAQREPDLATFYCRGVRNPASFVLSSTVIGSWTAFRTNWRSFSSKR